MRDEASIGIVVRFVGDKPNAPFPSLSLGSETASITAWSLDSGLAAGEDAP
jgi:hypothetical protein